MKNWEEEDLEKFIRNNRDKFNEFQPEPDHDQHFLNKLINKFREVINIVPYLAKAGAATILIFILSFLLWRTYICPPLSRISFKYWKAEHDYKHQINRSIRLNYNSIENSEQEAKFKAELQKYDEDYKVLKKQLEEKPSEDNIANMLKFYKDKLLTLEENTHNFTNRNTPDK